MIVRDHSTFAHSPRLNAENRLVRAQELYAPTSRAPYTVTYAYDHKGRMARKEIHSNDGHDTLVKSTTYLWDGWNIIRETSTDFELQTSNFELPSNSQTLTPSNSQTDYVWGLDIDGSLQGAGGVGGLLAVIRHENSSTPNSSTPNSSTPQLYFPTYDANGNVSEYVTTNGEIVAHYDCSPFGETLIKSGDLADTFTHRFSTKPWCPVTGLYEYQMRKYKPEIGRWMSRDPIEENGGENLYLAFVNSIGKYDLIGKRPSKFSCCQQDTIADGKAFLIKLYEEKKKEMESEGIPHRGSGQTSSCNAVNSAILDYFLNSGIPKCWSCTLATRWRRKSCISIGIIGRANHTAVLCRSYDTNGKEVETILFDYWANRSVGENPSTWFYSHYDEENPPHGGENNHIDPVFQPIWPH